MGKKIVILGAGLAGLSAGWVLARNGFEVTLIEKTALNGGLAITKKRDGYEYDLGPHNIHSIHNHIITFLRRQFSGSLFKHDPRSKILKNNKFIDYPLKGLKVLTSLPFWRLPIVALSFLDARLRMFLSEPKNDKSFEDWISNRFGKSLYNEYFGNYAGKVWGIHPSGIDKYVAEKRVPVINFTELIRAGLLGKTARVSHPEFIADNYYLHHGIGELVNFFEKELSKYGAQIENDASPAQIHVSENRATAVTYKSAGKTIRKECDFLLSTIPINEAVGLFENANTSAVQAASELDYCSVVLLFIKLNRRNVLPSAMLYFSDPKVPFSRIYDVGMYSYKMVPTDKTMLCLEFPCAVNDTIWNSTDEELARLALAILERDKILNPGDSAGAFCERISHSYPRFRVGFQSNVKTCFEFFAQHDNFISFGRQGSFAYLNTDGVMNLGFNAADAIITAELMGYRCHEWFAAKTRVGYS